MLIGRDDISNDVITLGTRFHVFYNVCLHSRWFPLCAHWRKSDSSVDREPQGNWRWNSNSRDVLASSPNYCLLPFPAPLPERLDLSVSCPTNSRHFLVQFGLREQLVFERGNPGYGVCAGRNNSWSREENQQQTQPRSVTMPMLQFKQRRAGRQELSTRCHACSYLSTEWKIKLRIRLYFLYLAPSKLNGGTGTHMLTLPNNLLGRIPAQCPNWSISWSLNLNLFFTTLNKIQRNLEITRDLKIEVFRHFQRTANIKKSHDQGFAVRFVVWGSCLYT